MRNSWTGIERQDVSAEPAVDGNVPRTRYQKGIRRRQEIVQAASAVFAEFGYTGGSIRTIAERVGVSPAALLQHFGSKEGLLMAVLDDWAWQQKAGFAGRRDRGLSFVNRLRDIMRYHLDHRGLIELFLTMCTEASSPSHPAREFIQNRYLTTLAEVRAHLREAIVDGEIAAMTDHDIDREARTLFAVMDGLELQWLIDPAIDLARLFDEHLDATIKRWRSTHLAQSDDPPCGHQTVAPDAQDS